jgi:hypothetical protein
MFKNYVDATTKKVPIPHIAMSEVKSSQVKHVGYDPATKTLALTFTRGLGAVYHYPNVSPETHQALLKAESIGSHFGKHIKPLPFAKYVPKPVEKTDGL